MGVDLTICPERYPGMGGPILLHSRLDFDRRDYGLWEKLSAASTMLSEEVMSYEDEGIKTRSTDPYGDKLKFLTAEQFAQTWAAGVSPDPLSDWDQGIIEFVKRLKPDRRLILWWH